MIWFFYILLIVFLAAYVYFSLKVATKLLTRILDLEKQVSDLFDNDEWCAQQIGDVSDVADSALENSQDNYDKYMKTSSKIWQKIDNLSNDINRAKMRIGKLEQGGANANNSDYSITDPIDPIVITYSEENSSQSNS